MLIGRRPREPTSIQVRLHKRTTERLVCCFSSQKCKISSAIKLTFKIQNWFIACRCWLFATLHYRFINLSICSIQVQVFPLISLAYQSKPWPPIHANKSLFWLSVFFLNGLMRISLVIFVVGSFDWTLVVSLKYRRFRCVAFRCIKMNLAPQNQCSIRLTVFLARHDFKNVLHQSRRFLTTQ